MTQENITLSSSKILNFWNTNEFPEGHPSCKHSVSKAKNFFTEYQTHDYSFDDTEYVVERLLDFA